MSELGSHVGDGFFGYQMAREAVTQIVEAVAANSSGLQGAGEPLAYPTLVEVTTLCVDKHTVGHISPFVLKGLCLTHAIESAQRHGQLLTHIDFASRAGLRGSALAG